MCDSFFDRSDFTDLLGDPAELVHHLRELLGGSAKLVDDLSHLLSGLSELVRDLTSLFVIGRARW
jgi:hypothetical protein